MSLSALKIPADMTSVQSRLFDFLSKHHLLCIFFAALTIRTVWFFATVGSPLIFFSTIAGLDMKTHLELGRIFASGGGIYTHYRALCALAGGNITALICIQYLGGALLAMLTAYCAEQLWKSPLYGCCAGLICALYAPELVYESVTLPESLNTLLALAIFAALLFARERNFDTSSALLLGALLGGGCCGRPAMLLYVTAVIIYIVFRAKRRSIITAAAAFMVIISATSLFALKNQAVPLPFYCGNLSYIAAVGQQSAPQSLNTAPDTVISLKSYFAAVMAKLPLVFNATQIPNNVNYCFLRSHFPPCAAAIPALFLYICGISGGVLLLLQKRMSKNGMELLTAAAFITLSMPLLIFYPLGRYKLMVFPFLALWSAYFLVSTVNTLRNFRTIALRAAILPAAALLTGAAVNINTKTILRNSDFINWGIGYAKMDDPLALDYFRTAFMNNPGNRRAALLYAHLLHKAGEEKLAAEVWHRHRVWSRSGNPALPAEK